MADVARADAPDARAICEKAFGTGSLVFGGSGHYQTLFSFFVPVAVGQMSLCSWACRRACHRACHTVIGLFKCNVNVLNDAEAVTVRALSLEPILVMDLPLSWLLISNLPLEVVPTTKARLFRGGGACQYKVWSTPPALQQLMWTRQGSLFLWNDLF